MAFEITRQEITKQANDLLKLFRQTRDQKYKDEELRLRRIVTELETIVIGGGGGGAVDRIIAGTNISISPSGGTGDVTINATTLNPDPTGYGSFYSNVTQTLSAANTPQAVTLGQTYEAVGTSTSGSRIYMDKAGTYQFSYVAQLANSTNSQEYAEFWIKYNGVNYPNSNTKMILQPRKSSTEPSEQLMTLIISGTSLNDNDYIELFWEATSTQVSLKYDPASGSYPATPSIIANIIPIGAQGRDSNLNELNDVLIASPTDGQVLKYNQSLGVWENGDGGSVLYTKTLVAYRTMLQPSGTFMDLSLDGTGVTGLIEPSVPNATWNVTIDTIATVINVIGDAPGMSIGDTYSETTRLVFKRIGGISTLVAIVSSEAGFDASMTTALMNYSVGGTQNLNLQFQFPTFAGAGSVQINAISKLEIVEATY
jgi:hypothetical protein